MSRPTTSKGETWSRGTNSRLPFYVNVMLNLSNISPFVCNMSEIVDMNRFISKSYTNTKDTFDRQHTERRQL